MTKLRGHIWPDGSWGLGFERKLAQPFSNETHETHNESDFWKAAIGVHGVEAALDFHRELYGEGSGDVTGSLQSESQSGQGEGIPLISSESPNSHKSPSRGSPGITSFGRKMIKSGATLLEEEWGKSRLTMATFTIGYRGVESWQRITENWAEIVRRLSQEIRRCLIRSGLKDDFLYCIELQEGRLEKFGHGGLHLHFLWPNSKPGRWSVGISKIKATWSNILSSYVPSSVETLNHGNRVELALVKKSVAGYLSKYLSKGLTQSALQLYESRGFKIPSSWWGMSSSLRHCVKSRIVTISGDAATALLDGIRMGAFRGSVHQMEGEYLGEKVLFGYYGWLGEWNKEHPVYEFANEEKNTRQNELDKGLVCP